MPDPVNMATSGKKSKKAKGITLSLNSFLQETPGTVPPIPLRKTSSNWADEVEDTYENYDGGRNSARPANLVLPTAPKAARGLDDFSDKIPQQPPYNVYLSNLPYDVDADEIAEFFGNLKIVSMRIPREDRESSRVRGYGYVEFEDQESLIEALEKPCCMLKGRRVRIEIATNTDNDKRRGRMDMNRDRADRPEAPTGDWRSGGRKEPEGPERRYRDGGRDFNREDRSAGMWRDSTDRPAFRDRENNDRFRDVREDKPITREAPPRYDSMRDDRRGFGPRRDRDDRMMDRSNGYFRRDERPEDAGRQRPKLNLAPRTLRTDAESGDKEEEPRSNAAAIFGNAKPVDTTAREREIEERLAKQNEVESRAREDDRKPEGRRWSPERRRYSPRRESPPRHSQDRREASADEEREVSTDEGSTGQHRGRSADRRREGGSPRHSPDKSYSRDDIRKRNERNSSGENKDRIERRTVKDKEYIEKEMPKIKTPEPINIVGPNKYAFLEDDNED